MRLALDNGDLGRIWLLEIGVDDDGLIRELGGLRKKERPEVHRRGAYEEEKGVAARQGAMAKEHCPDEKPFLTGHYYKYGLACQEPGDTASVVM